MFAGDGEGVRSADVAADDDDCGCGCGCRGGGVTAIKGYWFKPRSHGGDGEGVGKACAEMLVGW